MAVELDSVTATVAEVGAFAKTSSTVWTRC